MKKFLKQVEPQESVFIQNFTESGNGTTWSLDSLPEKPKFRSMQKRTNITRVLEGSVLVTENLEQANLGLDGGGYNVLSADC